MAFFKRFPKSRAGWALWAVVVLGGCIIISLFMQAVGILPSPEERQQTETAQAVQALAQLPTLADSPEPLTPTIEVISPTAGFTLTSTIRPSNTPRSTDTASPTRASSTPSNTSPPTNTRPPTNTPPPSATPSTEQIMRDLVERNVAGDVISVGYSGSDEAYADWQFSENIFGSSIPNAKRELIMTACALRDSGLIDGRRLGMSIWIDIIDRFGNESKVVGVNAVLEWDTLARINCANADRLDISTIAELFIIHPLVE